MKKFAHRLPLALMILFISMFTAINANAQTENRNQLLIGDKVPSFEAATSQGIMNFPDDFYGKWKIIFSHPGNYTPVCTSEFLSFALMQDEFEALNCELIGLSVDGYNDHLAWTKSMESIEYKGHKNIQILFPIISDIYMNISEMFGMIHPNATTTHTIRAVYIIDPDDVVNAILYYPDNVGRNIEEIKRLLIALQTSQKYDVATPADWEPGDDVLLPVPDTKEKLGKREKDAESGKITCLDWYFCFKQLPLKGF